MVPVIINNNIKQVPKSALLPSLLTNTILSKIKFQSPNHRAVIILYENYDRPALITYLFHYHAAGASFVSCAFSSTFPLYTSVLKSPSVLAVSTVAVAAPTTLVAVLAISTIDEIGAKRTISSTGSPAAAKRAVAVIVAVPGTPTVPMETRSVSAIRRLSTPKSCYSIRCEGYDEAYCFAEYCVCRINESLERLNRFIFFNNSIICQSHNQTEYKDRYYGIASPFIYQVLGEKTYDSLYCCLP